MKKYIVGIIAGLIGAVINIIFLMFAKDIETAVYVSTGTTWIASGLLIAACDFKINSIVKGMIVAVLVSASSLVYTFSASISGGVWSLINTIIIGGIIGFITHKTK